MGVGCVDVGDMMGDGMKDDNGNWERVWVAKCDSNLLFEP